MRKEMELNLQKSPESELDWHISNILTAPSKLPSQYSLKQYCGKVMNQGAAGLCHSYAGAAFKEIQEHIETSKEMNMSPIALAKEVKKIDGLPTQEGSDILSVFRVLYKQGTIKDEDYPYSYEPKSLKFKDVENEKSLPHYRIGNYARCDTLADIKYALTLNKPVEIGIICFSNFYDIWDDPFCPMPKGRSIGGHAMTVVGYDDNLTHKYSDGTTCTGYLHVLNSWGEECGDGGFIYIPYDYINKKTNDELKMSYMPDAYTGIDIQNDPINQDVVEMWIGKNEMVVNDKTVILDQAPEIDPETSRALIPVRWVESLGYKVYWNDKEKKITILKYN